MVVGAALQEKRDVEGVAVKVDHGLKSPQKPEKCVQQRLLGVCRVGEPLDQMPAAVPIVCAADEIEV